MHGFPLDDKHKLRVEEQAGVATIRLLVKTRAPGGPAEYAQLPGSDEEPTIRYDDTEVLARIRSEVLRPAAPNYLGNPGERYRVTVEGMSTAPEYVRVFEADAAVVLEEVFKEVTRLYSRAEGVRRDALYMGGLLTMNVLFESGYLPAQLSRTVLRSKVSRFRIQGPEMKRVRQSHLERLPGIRRKVGPDAVPETDK